MHSKIKFPGWDLGGQAVLWDARKLGHFKEAASGPGKADGNA